MAKVKNFVRRIFRSGGKDELMHQRLRRAVTHAKPRQVAELLELGASPVWRSVREPHELNALLLACQRGDAYILNLLLDWFFHERTLLALWGPQMYCMAIRNGHWQAFLRLHQRNVPQVLPETTTDATSVIGARLPAPVFVAAESGQPQILAFLLRQPPQQPTLDWRVYTFSGHSLLSIASKHGHYACVEALLACCVPSADEMAFAVDCARRHRQAHVLVLLTSCLPEYNAPHDDDGYDGADSYDGAGSYDDLRKPPSTGGLEDLAILRATRGPHRGSLTDTDLLSELDDGDLERRSSAWLRGSIDPVLGDAMPFSGNSDEAAYQRFDPNRQTMDGFAILEAARVAERKAEGNDDDCDSSEQRQTSSGELTWSSSSAPISSDGDDDERWYAMQPLAGGELMPLHIQSNTSTNSDASTDPFTDFDGTFHNAVEAPTDAAFAYSYDKTPELMPPPVPVVPFALAPPVSNKIISIRSSNFRSYRTLPSITEERHTMVEHE